MCEYLQIKGRYYYHFSGDSKVIQSMETFLDDLGATLKGDELIVGSFEPISTNIIDYMAKIEDFVMYVTYENYDCGCWNYCNGKEYSIVLKNVRREMGHSMAYREFLEREKFLTNVTNKIINGITYENFVEFINLSDYQGIDLIQNFYYFNPFHSFNPLNAGGIKVERHKIDFYKAPIIYNDKIEPHKIDSVFEKPYEEYLKANKTLIENMDIDIKKKSICWKEEYFWADRKRLFERLKNGDIDADWTNHFTIYEYTVLALPEIQRRLKAGDTKAFHLIDKICKYLQILEYKDYEKWLLERPNFSDER